MTSTLTQNYLERFGGIARLYGDSALKALNKAHFAVIGLGGVGTWAAEALARSGIGTLTLVELDDVCITNTNRQIHTTASTIGHPKNHVIAQRLLDINPELCIHRIDNFLHKNNIKTIIGKQHDVVVDATDAVHMKAALASYCSALKIRLILSGSSGGKRAPHLVTVDDLARTIADPMLSKVRRNLYRQHNFIRDKNRKFRIDAIYSTEQMTYPKPDGSVSMDKQILQEGVKLDCAGGFGSSVMVTGTFGFLAASKAVERYLEKNLPSLNNES